MYICNVFLHIPCFAITCYICIYAHNTYDRTHSPVLSYFVWLASSRCRNQLRISYILYRRSGINMRCVLRMMSWSRFTLVQHEDKWQSRIDWYRCKKTMQVLHNLYSKIIVDTENKVDVQLQDLSAACIVKESTLNYKSNSARRLTWA